MVSKLLEHWPTRRAVLRRKRSGRKGSLLYSPQDTLIGSASSNSRAKPQMSLATTSSRRPKESPGLRCEILRSFQGWQVFWSPDCTRASHFGAYSRGTRSPSSPPPCSLDCPSSGSRILSQAGRVSSVAPEVKKGRPRVGNGITRHARCARSRFRCGRLTDERSAPVGPNRD